MVLDLAYVPRLLLMHESLQRVSAPDSFVVWVLCVDDETARVMRTLDLESVRVVELDDIADPALREARASRSRREHAFAAKPFIVGHVLAACPAASRVTLLDADLLFLADPAPVMDAVRGASMVLSSHRWRDATDEERFGEYNAGWLSFSRGPDGEGALARWRDLCIVEGTPDFPTDGRFAEQGYLADIADALPGVAVLSHAGMNVGAWNLRPGAVVEVDGDVVCIDGTPLVLFHLHGLDRWSRRVFGAPAHTGRAICAAIHRPYVTALCRREAELEVVLGHAVPRTAPWGSTRPRPWWWRTARVVRRRVRSAATGSVVRAR